MNRQWIRGKGLKKRPSKLQFSGWIWLLALFILLAGCGNQEGSTEENQTESSSSNEQSTPEVENSASEPEMRPEVPTDPVELVFYSCSNSNEETFRRLYGDAINQKYPDFKLTYLRGSASAAQEKIPQMLLDNTLDINFDSIGNYPACVVRFELQKDMSDLIKKFNIDLQQFDANAVNGTRMLTGGEITGVPVFNNTRLLYYNRDLFAKFGVPVPTDGMSWDEVIALGKMMTRTDGGVNFQGLTSSIEHQVRMNALSIPMVDQTTGKPTINTDPRWKTVFSKGYFEPYADQVSQLFIEQGFGNVLGRFATDKTIAMLIFLANASVDQQGTMAEVDWEMVTEPYYSELPGIASQVYPTYFSVTSQSKQRDAAMMAIEVLVSVEHQMFLSRQGQIPVLLNEEVQKSLGQDSVFKDKNWQAIFKQQAAPIPNKSMYDVELENIYRANLLQYSTGQTDLNTFLRTAEEAAEKFLETQNN